jgi:hypothetical protein
MRNWGSAAELRSIAERLTALEEQVAAIAEQVRGNREVLTHEIRHHAHYSHKDVEQLRTEMREHLDAQMREQLAILQLIYDDEPGQRQRLWALRETPEYAVPFDVPNPLVTVYIPTYTNAEYLANRSIPSVLAQTYENFELLVIGDAATPEVEEAARSFDDPRVRFENLPLRGPYPSDRERMWFVAGAAPANEALRVARGHWLAPQDDDDAFTPDHLQVLLDDARSRRLELSYGLIRRIAPDGSGEILGAWPPEAYNFGLQSVLFHRGLRMFQFETADALFGNPGDWAWVRRMLRVGVRIGRIDVPVVDYFPAQLWRENEDPPLD